MSGIEVDCVQLKYKRDTVGVINVIENVITPTV